MDEEMRPLDGLLVLDFSTLLPGPLATLLLAEAGAEVVKIERPGVGDEMRRYKPSWGPEGDSVNFALLNRGKKSITLDLKDPDQRAKLDPLIARADILVEQFRPGVMARLGLDYDTLSKVNPRLIYCSITGYGQDGPKRDIAAHDLNYIGDAGLLSLSMGPSDRPVIPPALVADVAGGAYPAVINILLALQQRERTSRGCYLDVAMAENVFPFMFWALGKAFVAGEFPGNGDDRLTGGSPRYRLYPTADGRVVAAAPLEQKFWENFCDVIGLEPELRDDSRDPAATIARVAELIAAETSATWAQRFAGRDCCCSIVATFAEALNDPQFRSRGLFGHPLAGRDGKTIPALPVPIAPFFRGEPAIPIPAPALGAHNEEYF